ncbi:MAG: hypothetical protein JWM10_1893 [Myxococcaceae bacterium]|nr:hypothetical protein [Myxococcaceae bacterium]
MAPYREPTLNPPERARQWAIDVAVVVVGAALAVGLDQWKGVGLALRSQRLIIPAVDRYRVEQGHYPETLEKLVPRYLPSTRPPGESRGLYQITYSDAMTTRGLRSGSPRFRGAPGTSGSAARAVTGTDASPAVVGEQRRRHRDQRRFTLAVGALV